MVPEKAMKKFAAKYAEDVQELLVLTAEGVRGAALWDKKLWQPSCRLLAYIDTADGTLHGGLNKSESVLQWLVGDDEKGGWRFGLRPQTIYRVKARTLKGKLAGQYFMLLEVLERVQTHPQLDLILQAYLQPVILTDALWPGVSFELEREFNWFNARLDWLNTSCSVSLECDDGNPENAAQALAAFKNFYASLAVWDEKMRAFAAARLTQNANDWQEDCADDENPAPITEADFARRITISEFNMDSDGNFTAYYDDDEMFFCHSVLVEGNIDGTLTDSYLAG